jgi:putative ABC transport system permease protein
MKALRRVFARIRGALDVNARDTEVERELRAHLEFATEEFMRRGLSSGDARRAALLEARGIAQAQEAYRDQRGLPVIDAVTRNLRFALRGVRRNPGYSLAILLSLAFGIGLNTAIFTVADTVIRRPLPYHDPMEITIVGELAQRPGEPAATVNWMPYGSLKDWRRSKTLREVAHFAPRQSIVEGDAVAEYVDGGAASPNLLRVLGARPMLGRWFADNETGYPLVVISEALWRRQFNRDTAVVGRTMKLDGRLLTVIGVLPRGIGLPLGAQFWRPDNGDFGAEIIARPAPGTSPQAISAELEMLSTGVRNLRKAGYTVSVVTMPLHEQLFGPARPTLRLLFAAAVLFLLIACANVTNLVLARTIERRRELAVRTVLGASARSLAALVTIENMLLAGAGGVIGIGIAYLATNLLAAFAAPAVLMSRDVSIDGSTLLFATGLAVGCCALVSLAPIVHVVRDRSIFRLTQSGAQSGRAHGARRTRRTLVVTQLALALVLMAGAGLLLRSVARLTRAEHLGFNPDGVVILNLPPFNANYRGEALTRLKSQLVSRARALPGVVDVAIGPPPLVGGSGDEGWREGFDAILSYRRPGDKEKTSMIWAKYVDDRYAPTFGLRVRMGRAFASTDDSASQKVVMVNNAAAHVFFGTDNPIGRYLPATFLTDNKPNVALVVGVIDDALQNDLVQDAKPEVLLATSQRPGQMPFVNLAVKSSLPPAVMVGQLQRVLREVDPSLAPSRLESMSDVANASLARHRFVLRLLIVFAALGFALSIIGLYAVVSYLVAQRRTEIGVRMALGAQRRHVMGLVLGEGLIMAATGVLIGIPLTLGASRFLGSLLYEVQAWDFMSLAIGTALLAAVALVASYAPAQRAAALDPAATLRSD